MLKRIFVASCLYFAFSATSYAQTTTLYGRPASAKDGYVVCGLENGVCAKIESPKPKELAEARGIAPSTTPISIITVFTGKLEQKIEAENVTIEKNEKGTEIRFTPATKE